MHNMAKTIVKSQSIGDVKQGNNTKYDSCVSHFCKLVNCHRSFDSSFCSVKSEKIETISIFKRKLKRALLVTMFSVVFSHNLSNSLI